MSLHTFFPAGKHGIIKMYKNLTYLILIEQLLNQSSFLSLQLYIKGLMYCHYTFLLLIT